jgi:hypothetical protein
MRSFRTFIFESSGIEWKSGEGLGPRRFSLFTVKILLILLLGFLAGSAQDQNLPIGIIDFYGLRSVSEQQARKALQIKEGDTVPSSPQAAQRRLEALPKVRQARLNPVCCEAGKIIIYVGIRETGASVLQFRSAPTGAIRLPDTIARAGEAFGDALMEGVQKGEVGEDDSQGHALNTYPKLRAIQEQFVIFAARNLKLLRAVLHESADAQDRALAAQIIAYTANKQEVVRDLVYAMSDSDDNVRNNSMRALEVIAGFAQRSPQEHIHVPIQPFIKMLNSIVWTDRNKSSLALNQLTEKRNPAILSQLRQQALASLVEMARWKNPGHAYSPFFILGRAGNLTEAEIQKEWDSGNREPLIRRVLRKIKAK